MFNKLGPLLENLSANSFHMGLIHTHILVAISLLISVLIFFPLIKMAVNLPLAIILCYLCSHYINQKSFEYGSFKSS